MTHDDNLASYALALKNGSLPWSTQIELLAEVRRLRDALKSIRRIGGENPVAYVTDPLLHAAVYRAARALNPGDTEADDA